MNSQREIYQALLDGKTLINKCDGSKVMLKDTSPITCTFKYPEEWDIYEDAWKMKPAEWFISNWGDVMRTNEEGITITQEFGMVYHTKEHAERARDEMKEANLLRYWASVIDPDWKADWENEKQNKYYIYKTEYKDYAYAYNWMENTIGAIYMDEETADKICNALNSGELVIGDEQ